MPRRATPTFSLSFIDAVLCGFGAVVLLFLLLSHQAVDQRRTVTEDLRSSYEAMLLQAEELRRRLRELEAALDRSGGESGRLLARASTLEQRIDARRYELAVLEQRNIAREEDIARLKSDLRSREKGRNRLEAGAAEQEIQGERLRAFPGEGDRQYLTGLKLGGRHILVLVDSSASMLSDRIVEVLRLRSSSAERMRAATKWRRTLDTADWLATQLPSEAQFQIYAFGEQAGATLPGSDGRWLDAGDPTQLNGAVEALRERLPAGGTSLHQALEVVDSLDPPPDNLILITDGLPTIGRTPSDALTVTGKRRLRLFERATADLPDGLPVNVILLPMEGDPLAAPAYWRLAVRTRGSFMSPSRDWP